MKIIISNNQNVQQIKIKDNKLIQDIHYKTKNKNETPINTLFINSQLTIVNEKQFLFFHLDYDAPKYKYFLELKFNSLKSFYPYIIGTLENKLYIWYEPSGQLLISFKAHQNLITFTELNTKKNLLATTSNDGMINIWSFDKLISDPKEIQVPRLTLIGHNNKVNSIKFSSLRIYSIWDLRSGNLISTVIAEHPITNIIVDLLDTSIWVSIEDQIYLIRLYPTIDNCILLEKNNLLKSIKGNNYNLKHDEKVSDFLLLSNEKLLLSSSLDGKICLWNSKNGVKLSTIVIPNPLKDQIKLNLVPQSSSQLPFIQLETKVSQLNEVKIFPQHSSIKDMIQVPSCPKISIKRSLDSETIRINDLEKELKKYKALNSQLLQLLE